MRGYLRVSPPAFVDERTCGFGDGDLPRETTSTEARALLVASLRFSSVPGAARVCQSIFDLEDQRPFFLVSICTAK